VAAGVVLYEAARQRNQHSSERSGRLMKEARLGP
jgi:hypothetical protein